MFRPRKALWILIGGSLFLALTVILGAVATTTIARAQSVVEWSAGAGADWRHPGGPDFPGGPGREGDAEIDQYLADALGITVAELEAARESAHDAALDAAVANGDLTQEQADAVRTLRGLEGFGRGFGLGFRFRGAGAAVDMDALLADALGVSVDELQAARDAARKAALADAVANGDLTQEQADLLQARHALREYLDPQSLTAQVLGLAVDELQEQREAGATLAELLDNAGLTAEEFRTEMQAAYEAAVQQAVADGVITQEQADALQNGDGLRLGPGSRGGRGPGRGGRGFPGGPREWLPGAPDGSQPPLDEPTPSDGATGLNG